MKNHTKTFLFKISDMWWSKDLSYAKIDSVNPLHLIIDQINGYIEESNGDKY